LAENVLDHRLNCRTVYMNWLNRYLYWNMGYHVEHHMFPLVPYHALPKLHELVKADMPMPYNGLMEAYREIIPALLRQSKDHTYFIKRQLPTPSIQAREIAQVEITPVLRIVDGWLEVCESNSLEKEDVLRFDHEHQTYALYQGADGKFYATDGLCTHSNAHLADGYVKGTIIECANAGLISDRHLTLVGLRRLTYPVRERDGRLLVDVRAAGGYGVTSAAVTRTFRVVSNQNVATFIKELVLEPVDGSGLPEYQPGDYMQLDIPTYSSRSLKDVNVPEPYTSTWRAQGTFDTAANLTLPSKFSAHQPASDKDLRFNMRWRRHHLAWTAMPAPAPRIFSA
jgi:hypothetical protein